MKFVNDSKEIGCYVNLRKGDVIMIDFYISCLGWYDKDIFLCYVFKYKFSFSIIII